MNFMNGNLWGNSGWQWMIALLATIISFGMLMLIKRQVIKHFKKLAEKTTNNLDDFVIYLFQQTKEVFFLALALYIGMNYLVLVDQVTQTARLIVLLILLVQIGFWANSLVNFLISREVKKSLDDGRRDSNTLSVLGLIIKVIIWSIVLILVLDNIPGVNVDTLIAGLGIGGIAVGLAVQNILGDLFASLSIALDKPFVIGDTIAVGDLIGTIEKIGLKSTRVRSISGEQLIFSNSDLLASRIRNYQSMQRRRVALKVAVDYQTPMKQLQGIPKMMESIISEVEQVTFDRAHLNNLGDFSISFEVIYCVESPDYKLFMDVQQHILMEILARFEQEGIQIPFPTQTVNAQLKKGIISR